MSRKIVEGSPIDEGLTMHVTAYDNKRTAIVVLLANGELYGKLTVNIPELDLPPDAFFVKTWSENERLAQMAMDTGMFVDSGMRIPTGRVEAQVWCLRDGVRLT